MLPSRRARCYTTVSISRRAESCRLFWRIFVDWRSIIMHIQMYTRWDAPDSGELRWYIERSAAVGDAVFRHPSELLSASLGELLEHVLTEDNWYDECFVLDPEGTLVTYHDIQDTHCSLLRSLAQLPPGDRWSQLHERMRQSALAWLADALSLDETQLQPDIDRHAMVDLVTDRLKQLLQIRPAPAGAVLHLSRLIFTLDNITVYPFSVNWTGFYLWPFLDMGGDSDRYMVAVYDVHI